jgi:hypothetical protein
MCAEELGDDAALVRVKRILLDVDAVPYVPAGFAAQNRPPAVSVRLLDFFPRSEELILTDCLNTGFNSVVSELPTTTRSAPALPYAAQRCSQSTEGKIAGSESTAGSQATGEGVQANNSSGSYVELSDDAPLVPRRRREMQKRKASTADLAG